MAQRSQPKRQAPGLGILSARLLFAVQDELYARLADAGHGNLRRQHGLVLAYLDPEGSRATELAARAGRHKQIVGRAVDELEAIGYVERRVDPADRRAKLIVPTQCGRDAMRLSDQIMEGIELRLGNALGAADYSAFRAALSSAVSALTDEPP